MRTGYGEFEGQSCHGSSLYEGTAAPWTPPHAALGDTSQVAAPPPHAASARRVRRAPTHARHATRNTRPRTRDAPADAQDTPGTCHAPSGTRPQTRVSRQLTRDARPRTPRDARHPRAPAARPQTRGATPAMTIGARKVAAWVSHDLLRTRALSIEASSPRNRSAPLGDALMVFSLDGWQWPGQRDDHEHYKGHQQVGNCLRCTWARNSKRWVPRLPAVLPEWDVNVAVAAPKTWVWIQRRQGEVEDRRRKNRYVARCIVCDEFERVGPLDFARLDRHQRSESHQRQMMIHLGLARGPYGGCIAGAPPAADVMKVWQARVRNDGLESVGDRKKCDQIRSCIYEALRKERQRFLRGAETIALFRDESHGFILIRISACDQHLQHQVFTLGIMQTEGSDAFDINAATLEMIETFCTPLGSQTADTALSQHVRSKIEAVCVDSASNELKASRLMASPDMAPNLKARIRDRPHALRRILSRPWKADSNLQSLASTFVMDRNSICQRIQHSKEFHRLFTDNVQTHVEGPFRRTAGLGAAKHRFESWTKPFGMMIMTLPALVRTVEQISMKRPGTQEGRDADAFLDALCPESILQLGMMADASDEVLTLIRLFDDEAHDISIQSVALRDFQDRVNLLFRDAQCFTITGYTKVSMNFILARVHVVRKRGARIRTFGGPHSLTEEVKQTCLKRMRVWLSLARATIKTEFPDFELVHACPEQAALPRPPLPGKVLLSAGQGFQAGR